MYLLDTNICIYLLNSRSQSLQRRVKSRADDGLAISSVTYSELCYGIENGAVERASERWAHLKLFTRLVDVLALGEEVAVHYGKVRAYLKKRGRLIGPNDLFIAAHALSEGATLVTNNQGEFERVPGLVVENWMVGE